MQATVFWDFENVSVPNGYKGYAVVQQLKQLGLKLTNIHAIGNSNQLSTTTRNELEESVLMNSCSSVLKWTDVLYNNGKPNYSGLSPARSLNGEQKQVEDHSSIPNTPIKLNTKLVKEERRPSYSSIVNGGNGQRIYSEIRFVPLLRSLIGATSLSTSAVASCGFNSLQDYKQKASSLGLLLNNEISEKGLILWKRYDGVSSQLCLFRAAYYEGCRPGFHLLLDATFQIYNSNQSPILVDRDLLTSVLDNHFVQHNHDTFTSAEQFLRAASSNHYITTKENMIRINVPPMTTPSGTLLSLFDIMETYKLDTSHIGGLLNGAFVQYGFVNVKMYLEYACAYSIVSTRDIGKITMVYRLDIFKELAELIHKGLDPDTDEFHNELSVVAKKYGFQTIQDYINAAEEAGILQTTNEKQPSELSEKKPCIPVSRKDYQQLVSLLQNGPLSSSIIGEKLSCSFKSLGYETLKQYLRGAEKLNLVVLNANDRSGNIIVQLANQTISNGQDAFDPLVSFLQERKVYLLEAETKGLVKLHNRADPNGNMFVVLRKEREAPQPKFQALLTALKNVESSTSSALGPILGYSVRKFNYKNVKEYLLDAERNGIVKLKAEDHGSYVIYPVQNQPGILEKADSNATDVYSAYSNDGETAKCESDYGAAVAQTEIKSDGQGSMMDSHETEIPAMQPNEAYSNALRLNMTDDCRQVIDLITPTIVKFAFTWELEGNQVILKGSWDNWVGAVEMTKVGNKFVTEMYLPESSYEYKFVVDGEWRIDYTKPFRGLNNYC
ncbi:hypothetical protein HDV04_001868 [Boothiomyces sp. JEL0838]|nr:hypothetical protein HDV04_001868 [Boothiomyces sp. JEL0838]